MGYSILLLTNDNISSYILDNFRMKFRKEKESVWHHSDSKNEYFVSILKDPTYFGFYYNDKEKGFIKNFFNQDPNIYYIDTNNFNKAIDFVKNLPDELKILIDNDNGSVITKDSFLLFDSFEDFFENAKKYSLV